MAHVSLVQIASPCLRKLWLQDTDHLGLAKPLPWVLLLYWKPGASLGLLLPMGHSGLEGLGCFSAGETHDSTCFHCEQVPLPLWDCFSKHLPYARLLP